MLRFVMLALLLGLLSLSAAGCGNSEAVVAGAPTADELKIAEEEQKKVEEAERAEARKSAPAKRK
ncbi:hypothetical protein Pan44_52510 [Caulifigura coniformis]|uniref:Secreted protein n=1 Tax=Caulifigura coniformis TaxID=2527983 RepID=A0A517SM32_9PLAN|nr:hypothetical protein [Caulifigura coniformis]QDT57184.1 hypothetical protein Pan44_52510 [Caulifigura coniformis]